MTAGAAGTPPAGGRGKRGREASFPGQQRPPETRRRSRAANALRHQLHGLPRRRPARRRHGRTNLLRSQVALSDQEGELIVPIIQGSRQSGGMPAIPMSPEDAKAVAAYVRSVMATIGRQGMPPAVGKDAAEHPGRRRRGGPGVLRREVRAAAIPRPATCKGIATRSPIPRCCRTPGSAAAAVDGADAAPRQPGAADARAVTATVTLPSGENVEGRLVRIDDFLVTLRLPDGTIRTFRRDGDVPKVEVHDPMKAHRDLLRLHRQRHARRDRLPGDPEMTIHEVLCPLLFAAGASRWHRAAASIPPICSSR